MDAAGRGYLQEIAVPWNLLFDSAPGASQNLKASLQFWFADLTPRGPRPPWIAARRFISP
jgi:hypothetical protein